VKRTNLTTRQRTGAFHAPYKRPAGITAYPGRVGKRSATHHVSRSHLVGGAALTHPTRDLLGQAVYRRTTQAAGPPNVDRRAEFTKFGEWVAGVDLHAGDGPHRGPYGKPAQVVRMTEVR
jgi:hypothetical protein